MSIRARGSPSGQETNASRTRSDRGGSTEYLWPTVGRIAPDALAVGLAVALAVDSGVSLKVLLSQSCTGSAAQSSKRTL